MEEISSTLTVPFRLKNMTADESVLQTQIEITGLKLIASSAGLLSDHPGVLSPSISDYTAAQDLSSGCKSGNFSVLTVSADEDESRGGNIFGKTMGNEIRLPPEDGKVHTPYACGQFINYSCSYTVASDTTSACHEEFVPVKASFDKKSMTVTDVGDTTLGSISSVNNLGELEPRQELQRTASRSVFEVDYVPLWGVTSICGTRPEMEDAVAVVPRLLKIPYLMLASGQNLDLRNQHGKDLTAHFFGVYDGHGGSQVKTR